MGGREITQRNCRAERNPSNVKAKKGVFKNIKVPESLFLMYIFLVMDLSISSRKRRVNTKEEEINFQTKPKDLEKEFS